MAKSPKRDPQSVSNTGSKISEQLGAAAKPDKRVVRKAAGKKRPVNT